MKAGAVLALARNIAGAFGIAIFGTILQNTINANVLATAQNSFINIKNPLNMSQFTGLIILKSQIMAYGRVFVVASIFLFVGAILALTIKVDKENVSAEDIMIE